MGAPVTKEHEIVLALNQSADAGHCGSCHFFVRNPDATSEWDQTGRCKFRMPPTREFSRVVWDAESRPLDTVDDKDGCDFWRSSGKTYIVSQRIKP